MPIIKRDTSRTQVDAEIIRFPHPLKHKTRPSPTKRDGTLFLHGELTADGARRFCAKCDVFFPAAYVDHPCFVEGRR